MAKVLSDSELMKKVRGELSQIEFATLLGVSQSMVSDWERGAHIPSGRIWLRMAELSGYPENVYCWQRAGLSETLITYLLDGLKSAGNRPSALAMLAAKRMLTLASPPEPVTDLPPASPTPEEEKAKTLDDLVKRWGPLENPTQADWERVKAQAHEMQAELARHFGPPPAEPAGGEAKPPAAAKKVKRERRRKK